MIQMWQNATIFLALLYTPVYLCIIILFHGEILLIPNPSTVIKVTTVVCYCSGRVSFTQFESPLFFSDGFYSQWLHQMPDKKRQAPLHHCILWWNELWICLFKAKGASRIVMEHSSCSVLRNKWFATHLIFLSFFSIIEISLKIRQASITVNTALIFSMPASFTLKTDDVEAIQLQRP